MRDSAPPNMFLHVRFPYAEPSTFPKSVPVFRDILLRSSALRYMSMSVGVLEGSVREGRSIKVCSEGWKISKQSDQHVRQRMKHTKAP